MVSMNTDLSANFPMLDINYQGDGQYGISSEGATQGGASADATVSNKTVSEAEMNTMLAPFGLQAKDGQYSAADGFSISTSNVAAATSFNGAPALPDNAASSSGMSSVDGANGVFAFDPAAMETASLMWMALSTMAHTGMQDMKDATDIKHLMQKSKNEMAKAKISSKEAEIEAQRDAAQEAFVTAVVVAVVSVCLAGIGSGMTEAGKQTASGAMVSAAGAAMGGVVSAASDMASKDGGAQAQANEEALKQMHYEMLEGMADGAIQDAQANYEGAKESFKLALKIMTEHVERQTQISGTITRS